MIIATESGPIHCLEARAENAGGTIVLLHGIQGSASAWSDVMPYLTARYHVIAPNLRGRGRSFTPIRPEDYSLGCFAGDLEAVLAEIKGPILIVGWSMGCLTILQYLKHQGTANVAGLVLMSGSACLRASNPPAHWFQGDSPTELIADAARRAQRLGLTDTATDTAVAGAWIGVRDVDLRETLPRIGIPTLILHGEDDPDCPPHHAQEMAAAIAGASLEIWPSCGHVPMADHPGRVHARLLSFAQTVFET
ncbi:MULTISPECIES: alpha/beta fold hydrolase [unclassified Roseovarius]|uniref:alpha/beta fold hydrolase n=1 Tax=unclassified Roseovarius TaxID=2614913 RepID=UPI00273E5E1D|nr:MULTISPECIES: alpha/beta hydrolase [unclassified Roseovarius]